jgi:hypothetical protein
MKMNIDEAVRRAVYGWRPVPSTAAPAAPTSPAGRRSGLTALVDEHLARSTASAPDGAAEARSTPKRSGSRSGLSALVDERLARTTEGSRP